MTQEIELTKEEKDDYKKMKPFITSYEKTKKYIKDLLAYMDDSQDIKIELQDSLIEFILKN